MAYNLRYLRQDVWRILTHKRTLITVGAIITLITILFLQHHFTLKRLKKKWGDPSAPKISTKVPTTSTANPTTVTTERTEIPTGGKFYETCKQYMDNGFEKNGLYQLVRGNGYSFKASCVMDKSHNQAWMILQERSSGAVVFWNRTFEEYSNGFGNLTGDHWLGLAKISNMIVIGYKLRLKIEIKGERCLKTSNSTSEYYVGEWSFSMGPKSDNYRLKAPIIERGNFTFPLSKFSTSTGQTFSASNNHVGIKNSRTGGWWTDSNVPSYISLNGEYSCERTNSLYGLSVYIARKAQHQFTRSSYIHPVWTRMSIEVL